MNRKRQRRKIRTTRPPTPSTDGASAEWPNAHLHGRADDRKTRQLCRQVERAIGFAFSNAANDELRDLYVQSVEPAPNATHLLVVVSSLGPQATALTVIEQLEQARGYLRGEVAASIHRRKAPQLSFRPALPIDTDSTD